MPVLLRFSNTAYNRLGADVIDELVLAMHQVCGAQRDMDELRRSVDQLAEQVRTLSSQLAHRAAPP